MKPTTSTTTTSTTSKNLYFVRLESKTFWPGELVDPSKYTQEMLEIVEKKAKRKESFLKFVTFPSDEDYHQVTKETDLIPYDSDKKEELIKITTVKLLKLHPSQLPNYKSDVVAMETILATRSPALSSVWFDKITADEAKPEVATPTKKIIVSRVTTTPTKTTTPPVTPTKTTPTTSPSEKKRFSCEKCKISFDRINTYNLHKSSCKVSVSMATKRKSAIVKKISPVLKKENLKKKRLEEMKNILRDWDEEGEGGDPQGGGGAGGGGTGGWDEEEEEEKMPELRIFDTKTVETGEIERFDLGGESGGSGGGGAGGKKESSGDLFDRLLKRSVVGVEGEGTEEVGDEGDEGGEEHEKTPPETGDEGGVPDDPPEEEPVTMETESVAMETPETTENTEEIDTEALLLATMPPVLPPPLTDHAHQNYSETLEEEEMMEEETAPPSVTTPPTPEETTPTSPPSPPTPPPPPQTPLATIPQKPTATIKPQQITMETVLESQDSSKILELTTPLIETDNVVHLVPVENADGSITYMLLSLNGGNELRVNVGAGDSEATPTGRDLSTLEAIILDKPMDMGSILSMEQGSVAADEQVEGFSTATITTATTPSSSEGRHGDSWSNPL